MVEPKWHTRKRTQEEGRMEEVREHIKGHEEEHLYVQNKGNNRQNIMVVIRKEGSSEEMLLQRFHICVKEQKKKAHYYQERAALKENPAWTKQHMLEGMHLGV
jgi:hypothetical protein